MTARAHIRQADWTRAIKGAIRGGLPVGTFKVVEENGGLTVLPIAANSPSDGAADAERRMKEAFGE